MWALAQAVLLTAIKAGNMPAPKGNQFWKARAKHGRDKIFKTPQDLWEAACEYFQWCDDNPLQEEKAFAFQGYVNKEKIDLPRPYTQDGLSLFLGVNSKYLNQFEAGLDLETQEGQDFSNIVDLIKTTIKDQKFAGASVGLFNANIISRDLGLADKQDLTSSDGSMTPKPTTIELVAPKDDKS